MNKVAATLGLAASLACAPALAQRPAFVPGWYGGLGIGQASVDFGTLEANSTVDDKDTALQVRFGYRFHPNWAVEMAYWHLGDYRMHAGTGTDTFDAEVRATSFGASIVGILPLDRFDLYGRLGYARSELKASGTLGPFSSTVKEKENEWFAGIGGRFKVTHETGVFVEWQRHDKLELDAYFVGVDYRF
jgi:OmpA-OmpF porin, OOP family